MKQRPATHSRAKSTVTKEAMGAFCTDIANSTERIERYQESALKHHKKYLEATGKYFIRRTPKREKEGESLDELWVPGDGLWGVFFGDHDQSLGDSLCSSLWRTITSFAFGLSVANSPRSEEIEPIEIRGVFLAGRVFKETVLDKFILYNGRALNACGRVQSRVEPNSIAAGFVVTDGEGGELKSVETLARSPLIYPSGSRGLDQYLRRCPGPRLSGCRIYLNTTWKEGRRLLRFEGWRKRHELRGLGNCRVLTTRIRLELKHEPGFEVVYEDAGQWDRSERVLGPPSGSDADLDLHELLGTGDDSFSFLKEVYKKGKLRFTIPADKRRNLTLTVNGNQNRPRVPGDGKVTEVDFAEQPCCVLPTYGYTQGGGRDVLIQTYVKPSARVLCLSLARNRVLASYENWSDYLDSASPACEISFE